MAETKQAFMKKFRGVVTEFGENLKADKSSEAFEMALKLKDMLKSETMETLTLKEAEQLHLDGVKTELKKYWYINGEVRKWQGALRKKGDKFLEFAN